MSRSCNNCKFKKDCAEKDKNAIKNLSEHGFIINEEFFEITAYNCLKYESILK